VRMSPIRGPPDIQLFCSQDIRSLPISLSSRTPSLCFRFLAPIRQGTVRLSHLVSKFDPISTSWPLFALFDSKLDQLYLPILRPPSDSQSEGDADHQSHREESVLHHAQKYFECVATFGQGTHPFFLVYITPIDRICRRIVDVGV
jgi:hypothetical protein